MFAFISPIIVLYGLFDVSHIGEAVFRGPDAEKVAQCLVTRGVSRLETGQGAPCSTYLGDEERVAPL